MQKIRLIFNGVRAPSDRQTFSPRAGKGSGIVAGSELVGPQFSPSAEEALEFDGPVAKDAGVGGPGLAVFRDQVILDLLAEGLLQGNDFQTDMKKGGQFPKEVGLGGFGQSQVGMEAENFKTLFPQQPGGRGAVHPAAQSDGHTFHGTNG